VLASLRYAVAIQSKHEMYRGKTATSVCLIEYQLRPFSLDFGSLQTSPQFSHAFCAVEGGLHSEALLRSLSGQLPATVAQSDLLLSPASRTTLLAESESYFWSVRDDRACSASKLGADGGFGSLHEHLASDAMILQRL
jgi:hypothetical protein